MIHKSEGSFYIKILIFYMIDRLENESLVLILEVSFSGCIFIYGLQIYYIIIIGC